MSLVNQFNSLQNYFFYKVNNYFHVIVSDPPAQVAGTISHNAIIGHSNDFFTYNNPQQITCLRAGYYELYIYGFWTMGLSPTSFAGSVRVDVGFFKNSELVGGISKESNTLANLVNLTEKTSAFVPTGSTGYFEGFADTPRATSNTTGVYEKSMDFAIKYKGRFETGDTIGYKLVKVYTSGSSVRFTTENVGIYADMVISRYA